MAQVAYPLGGPDLIGKILERERRRLARGHAVPKLRKNQGVPADEMAMVADENAKGAALLRMLIDRMDVFMEDNDAVLVRLVLPLEFVLQLEMWGGQTEDLESAHDHEMHDYMDLAGE